MLGLRQLSFVLKLGWQPAGLVLFKTGVLAANVEHTAFTSFSILVSFVHDSFNDLEVVNLLVDTAVIEELLPVDHTCIIFGLF